MTDCSGEINAARKAVEDADAVLVRIGAGMSASGGLNYGDSELVKKWYPGVLRFGIKNDR